MLEDGERSRFLTPPAVANHRYAPVNALDYRRVMFTVDDTDETLAGLGARGARGARSQTEGPGPRRLAMILTTHLETLQ